MVKEHQSISVSDAVHKLQLSLLEGIHNDNKLFAAATLMSRADYNDVVTERSIVNFCGYPLCSNPLPSELPRKGRYRISLKEHKVYDLHETYMYCSSDCLINSRAFAGVLKEDRCSVLDSAKIHAVLSLFKVSDMEDEVGLGKDGDLGFSGLKIEEKTEIQVGEVPLEQWVGPSNAIEGYVPQREQKSKQVASKSPKQGSKADNTEISSSKDLLFNEIDFMSTIITKDEYSVSKMPSVLAETGVDTSLREPKRNLSCNDAENQFTVLETSSTSKRSDSKRKARQLKGESSKIVSKDEHGDQVLSSTSTSYQNGSLVSIGQAEEESQVEKMEAPLKPSLKPSGTKKLCRSITWADEITNSTGNGNLCEVREIEDMKEGPDTLVGMGKLSLMPSGAKKIGHSVTWESNRIESSGAGNLCEIREIEDTKEVPDMSDSKDLKDEDDMLRFASAEACALALGEALEAVASGESDITDAVTEAGIIILPHLEDVDEEESLDESDVSESEEAPLKWPRNPETHSDLFDSEDSWFDATPEGFNLTLSPFATMWNALFIWMTSSTLAYIYGRDESLHEEYLSVSGREYPRKIVLGDGRSSEIKQTLAGSLARALPGVVADLRLPIPVSTLEQGMGHMLNTMSFIDALPAFRMKQWQLIVLLFIEALSVSRIPALTPYMTNRRMFHKVLDGGQISGEEYEVMKDFIIPLGRAPQFSAQSGA